MTSPNAIHVRLLLTFLFCCFTLNSGFAQWHGDSVTNTVICDAPSQQDFPASCSDGADGAIIVWHDQRAGSAIYAQHIDAKGFVTWPKNGIKVCTPKQSNVTMEYPSVVSDGDGGAYIVWRDTRYSQFGTAIFGQHLLSDGTKVYPDTGLPLGVCTPQSTGATDQVITEDGRGNAFVAWEDVRISSQSTDIYMNEMQSTGIRFGLSFTGSTAAVRWSFVGYHYYLTFQVPTGTVHFPKSLANSPGCFIDFGGKRYKIIGVDNDTTLRLTPDPSLSESIGPWSIEGPRGIVVDSSSGKQLKPAIVKDGAGGCYIAWQSGSSVPTSIYAKRIDSNCNQLWNPEGPGFLVYRAQCGGCTTEPNSSNVSLSTDQGQLLLTWETTNPDANDTQDVFAARIRCSTPTDTTQLWGQSIGVTDGYLYNQDQPQIFGDDSIVNGVRGALVPFVSYLPPNSDGYHVAMIRVLGDGGNKTPPANASPNMWYFARQSHSQGNPLNGFKAMKIYDSTVSENLGQRNSVLAFWRDSRWSGSPDPNAPSDSVIYCQRIDRLGRKYFPRFGTTSTQGIPVCAGKWQAKQISLTPRSDGAIVVWTDFRNSSSDPSIYAQLVREDGSFTLPSDTSAKATTGPMATIVSQTGSFDGSICNMRCSNMRAIDTGAKREGFDSVMAVGLTNMQFTPAAFIPGADTVTFSMCVIDTFHAAAGSVRLVDKAGNTTSISSAYCTIADTLAPKLFADSASTGWTLRFEDNRSWDRGLRTIDTSNSFNVTFNPPLATITAGSGTFMTVAKAVDPALPAKVTFDARDTAGNVSITDSIALAPSADVTSSFSEHPSLTVYPIPATSALTIHMEGIDRATVAITDVFGRVVERFSVEGTTEWHPRSVAPGIYIMQAVSANTVLTKRIVLE